MNFDAIVVGSGFGGALAAKVLVEAGWRVLMLERGRWVARGPENWTPEGVGQLTEHYSLEAPYIPEPAGPRALGAYHCVGGPSVFYGGGSPPLPGHDLEPHPRLPRPPRAPPPPPPPAPPPPYPSPPPRPRLTRT